MLAIYIARHPGFADGEQISRGLYEHFRRKLYENVAGGTGLSVLYRFEPFPEAAAPAPIDFEEAEASAVVVLLDQHFVDDKAYMAWLENLTAQADAAGLKSRVFPVAIDSALAQSGVIEQAVRWDRWEGLDRPNRMLKLQSSLTYEFCRMLRALLGKFEHPDEDEDDLGQFLRKVQIFLSHSKRDPDGERIAKLIRDSLFQGEGLVSFFDVHDIPPGLKFNAVLLHQVRASAVVAVHTDSFSSREWCRREIIEAKRWNVPLVIANCISDLDERGFPYLGNVPVVRMDPDKVDRIDYVIARLLDEVLKDFLWRCRVKLATGSAGADVAFLPRPPELICLAGLPVAQPSTLVYPDPPLAAEEQRLFEEIAPNVRLKSMTEWLAGEGGTAT